MICNLTPHEVVVARPAEDWSGQSLGSIEGWARTQGGEFQQASWTVIGRWSAGQMAARVGYRESPAEYLLEGVPVAPRPGGVVTGLPEEVDGVFLIVSGAAHAEALSLGRRDTVCPDTTWSPLVGPPSASGQRPIVAVRRLLR